MPSIEKLKILTPLRKLPKNVGDLGKLLLQKALKSCPKCNKSTIWSHCFLVPSEFRPTYKHFQLQITFRVGAGCQQCKTHLGQQSML